MKIVAKQPDILQYNAAELCANMYIYWATYPPIIKCSHFGGRSRVVLSKLLAVLGIFENVHIIIRRRMIKLCGIYQMGNHVKSAQ